MSELCKNDDILSDTYVRTEFQGLLRFKAVKLDKDIIIIGRASIEMKDPWRR